MTDMGRSKEMSQGMIDLMSDGDFMLAVSNFDHAQTAEEVADVAERIAAAGERHELSVDEMDVAVRMAQVALGDSEQIEA